MLQLPLKLFSWSWCILRCFNIAICASRTKVLAQKKKAFEFASDNYDYGLNIEKGPHIMHTDSVHETRLKNPSRPRKGEKKVLQDGEMDA